MKLLNKVFLIYILLVFSLNAKNNEKVDLNFVNTPISHLTRLISEITGNNFISDGEISGNFTFVSQKPIPTKNLMSVYEMILRAKGYMIVNHEEKGFFMITRNNNPQRENIEFDKKGNNFEIKTEVINLKYFKPSKINKIIKPYFTKAGKVVADDQLGFVMLTDYHDSIEKIKKIIKRIDKPNNLELHWVKLQNVNIKNVFPQIEALSKIISTQYRRPISVIADNSSNTVIIAGEGNEYKVVEKLIKKIDKQSKLNHNSSVLYLKNSKSTDLVKIITEMEKTRYDKGDIKDRERIAISHDKSLNSIILMGEQSVVNDYKAIINNLDKPKKQVYIEAQIIEINEEKAKNIGVKFDSLLAGGAGSGGAWAVHGNINNSNFPALTTLGSVTGAALSKVTNGISIGATINLLKQNGASKTLSSPKLLALDNQESSIYVGKVQPIVTEVSQQADTTTVPVTSYSYKDIGLTLKIKPQIMTDNKVRLDITVKLEDITGESASDTLPTTTKREINTTAIVNNGDDIVIAGLIRTKNDKTTSKVPVLGDLPFVGGLFRNTSTNNDRVNLVVILRPSVIKDVSQLPKNTKRIKREILKA